MLPRLILIIWACFFAWTSLTYAAQDLIERAEVRPYGVCSLGDGLRAEPQPFCPAGLPFDLPNLNSSLSFNDSFPGEPEVLNGHGEAPQFVIRFYEKLAPLIAVWGVSTVEEALKTYLIPQGPLGELNKAFFKPLKKGFGTPLAIEILSALSPFLYGDESEATLDLEPHITWGTILDQLNAIYVARKSELDQKKAASRDVLANLILDTNESFLLAKYAVDEGDEDYAARVMAGAGHRMCALFPDIAPDDRHIQRKAQMLFARHTELSSEFPRTLAVHFEALLEILPQDDSRASSELRRCFSEVISSWIKLMVFENPAEQNEEKEERSQGFWGSLWTYLGSKRAQS